MLIWCEKWKIRVETKWQGNCPACILWDAKEEKCKYDTWHPGLKEGKDEPIN